MSQEKSEKSTRKARKDSGEAREAGSARKNLDADDSPSPRKPKREREVKKPSGPREWASPFTRPAVHTNLGHVPRGLAIMLAGLGATFLLMANEGRVAHGPLWGMLAMIVGAIGLLDFFGLFSDRSESSIRIFDSALFARKGEPIVLAPVVTIPVAIIVFVIGVMAKGYDGLPITICFALAPLLLSAIKRPAFLVFTIAAYLFLPLLGVYGLWDPWETHYGEVAREILSRDDWISLWWAQEDFFWSKPILIFWVEALSMGAHGVNYLPDANPSHPEWAIRLPIFLLTMGALLSVYAVVQRTWSKRAGVIAALVLATMPHFFFLSHQAITDMPFVACMTMAVSMFALAIGEDPAREVDTYAIGPLTLSARHLVLGALTLVIVPQFLYLFSRNVTFMHAFPPFGWHSDLFTSGSAGNHGVPGNTPVHNVEPFLNGLGAQPAIQAILWLGGFLLILLFTFREKRARSLYMVAFYLFCALAFMAKGIPGFALPGLVALLFLFGARRWDLLLTGQLRVALGIAIVLVSGTPWFVAMYVRHGPAFTERLLIHDHINRLTSGVHGDNGSIEYFVEQMGYGLFPWIAFVPLALVAWLGMRAENGVGESDKQRRREVLVLIALWLASAFTLFSAMTTKFHHYIFPAVPPTAILVGLAIDRLLEPAAAPGTPTYRRALTFVGSGLAALAPVPAILGVAGLWGDVRGIIPEGLTDPEIAVWVLEHPWPSWQCWGLITISAWLFALAALLLLPAALEPEPRAKLAGWRPAMTTGLLTAPVLIALVGRDLSWVTDARPQGYERLIDLFVYNYERQWPDAFDYRPILTGFAIVATACVVLAAFRPIRGVAVRAFLGVALAFAVWSLDVHMIDLSPHWGQRELLQAYYASRSGPEEPVVAWQMNWKGENFYTGNRANVFVDLDNRLLNDWVRERRGTTAFFLLEHNRLGSLRSVLRDSAIEEITTERLNNKFLLIRAHLGQRTPTVRQRLD